MKKNAKAIIIQALKEIHSVSDEQIQSALFVQKKTRKGLGKVLVEQELIPEKDLTNLFSEILQIPYLNLKKYKIDPALKDVFSQKVADQYKVMPVSVLAYSFTCAVSDPLDVVAIDDLKSVLGKEVHLVLSTQSEIQKAFEDYYGLGLESMSDIKDEIDIGDFEIVSDDDEDEGGKDTGQDAPIIRLVNLIVKESIKQGVSDIHIEPMVDMVRVRYRIDGKLKQILTVPKAKQNALITRLKIMSRLDITTSSVPQDGRFKMSVGNKQVDFRVSLLPTNFGQKVVMRILDKSNLSVGLAGLGMAERSRKILEEAIRKPFGMVLVTGPTGSGKSTTLYSLINALNTPEKNIITVEDPVEFMVDGLSQIQVRAEIGFTFAEGLKSILRQSPDVVMVGEIRDGETADISIKAALTGQIVLSTLHTNDATGALTRLIDMGVEPFLVASSVVVVSAQRLGRKICASCKAPLELTDEIRKSVDFEIPDDVQLFHGTGCEICNNTGYKGRCGITEILEVTTDVQELLLKGKTSDEIKTYAEEKGSLITLRNDALEKCFAGVTTLEEVMRVTMGGH